MCVLELGFEKSVYFRKVGDEVGFVFYFWVGGLRKVFWIS